jgi:hypothetical protein
MSAELSNPLPRPAMFFDIYTWLAQRLPRIGDKVKSGLASEDRATAQKADLSQQQAVLADQLAKTRAPARQREARQIAATAATQEQRLQDLQESATTTAAYWLVFSDPAPPTAKVMSPIRYSWQTSDWTFGDVGGRPTDGMIH